MALGNLQKAVQQIQTREKSAGTLPPQDILSQIQIIRQNLRTGKKNETVQENGFALIREVTRRVLGKRLYDVQIMAGVALVSGNIVELAPGEGKTLVAVLPGCIHGWIGKGAHIVAPNSYLAQRDYNLTKPIYEALGISVGLLPEKGSNEQKIEAYQCDVTYGTSYSFGFDYLRDQLKLFQAAEYRLGDRFLAQLSGNSIAKPKCVQRGHNFALIDEVDSVLIDEARSPLVISGGESKDVGHNPQIYIEADRLAGALRKDTDYFVEKEQKNIQWSHKGILEVQKHLAKISRELRRPWIKYVEQALRAHLFYRKDIEYIVDGQGRIVIIDEFSGRKFADRTWRDGLHQAIEAKEGIEIQSEHLSLARITRQRYFQLYHRLSGMTGTTAGSEKEFSEVYQVSVIKIPPRLPSRRQIYPPRIFATWQAKWNAIAQEVLRLHQQQRPILIGTRTISQSEECARILQKAELSFRLLNARQDAQEAEIIAQAGRKGAITIATNMAGRGTDIILDEDTTALGALHVIAVERHEAKRIDDQLIGRCARQGTPGSAQFFISCEDMLVQLYDPDKGKKLLKYADERGEIPSKHHTFFDQLQKKAERAHFEYRKKLLVHDNWLEKFIESL